MIFDAVCSNSQNVVSLQSSIPKFIFFFFFSLGCSHSLCNWTSLRVGYATRPPICQISRYKISRRILGKLSRKNLETKGSLPMDKCRRLLDQVQISIYWATVRHKVNKEEKKNNNPFQKKKNNFATMIYSTKKKMSWGCTFSQFPRIWLFFFCFKLVFWFVWFLRKRYSGKIKMFFDRLKQQLPPKSGLWFLTISQEWKDLLMSFFFGWREIIKNSWWRWRMDNSCKTQKRNQEE